MKYILLSALLLPLGVMAQKKSDTLIRYFSRTYEPTSQKNNVYEGKVYPFGNGWKAELSSPKLPARAEIEFSDKKLRTRNGKFLLLFSNGVKLIEGQYQRNIPTGVWITRFDNNQTKDSGMVVGGKQSGEWRTYYANGNPRLRVNYAVPTNVTGTSSSPYPLQVQSNIVANLHGPYLKWHKNGVLADSTEYRRGRKYGYSAGWYENGNQEWTGSYINDRYDGEWRWYYENGQPATIEKYVNRELVDLQCFDSTGKNTGPYCSVNKPAYILGPIPNIQRYIFENLTWPDEAFRQRLDGHVTVKFTVSKLGKLTDLTIVSSTHQMFTDEVKRLFDTLPDWSPSIQHNMVKEADFTIEIPFRHD